MVVLLLVAQIAKLSGATPALAGGAREIQAKIKILV
jgi:hypothetical protein